MPDYSVQDYTFEALCLKHVGPEITTLAYVVGLVDSETHEVRKPNRARYDFLYPLAESASYFDSPEELLSWQAEILPAKYLPQTPVMFAQRWSPIIAMLEKGFEPVTLARYTFSAPTAVASGIWRPSNVSATIPIAECVTDAQLFWAIMSQVFDRAKDRDWLVSISRVVIRDGGWQLGALECSANC